MNRVTLAVALAAAVAVPAHAQQEPAGPAQVPQEHARYDFRAVVDGQEQILTYEGTHDVMRPDPAVKLVVFVHHGGSQNPVTYFNGMKAALGGRRDMRTRPAPDHDDRGAGDDPETHVADNPALHKGTTSVGTTAGGRVRRRSTLRVATRPARRDGAASPTANVKSIVHVGHSAGGS
jgi:hypothetical protein